MKRTWFAEELSASEEFHSMGLVRYFRVAYRLQRLVQLRENGAVTVTDEMDWVTKKVALDR